MERQKRIPGSLLDWHRSLIHLRKRYPSLWARHDSQNLSYRKLETDAAGIYAYLRSTGEETPLVVINNLSRSTIDRCSLELPSSNLNAGDYRLREVFPGSKDFFKVRVGEDGSASLSLPRPLGARSGLVGRPGIAPSTNVRWHARLNAHDIWHFCPTQQITASHQRSAHQIETGNITPEHR